MRVLLCLEHAKGWKVVGCAETFSCLQATQTQQRKGFERGT